MRAPEDLLLAAVRAAPRRYRLPPLPAGIEAARAAGHEPALAFAIEQARVAAQLGRATSPDLRALFTHSLAGLIGAALAAEGGDAAFQALVLRRREQAVDEYVRLAARAPGDRRAVRSAVDAVAHPGKLRATPAGPLRDALSRVHELAADGAWSALGAAIRRLPAREGACAAMPPAALQALLGGALERLVGLEALLRHRAVQLYLALCDRRGPAAGSEAAAASGRAAARTGEAGEAAALQAFGAIAALLDGAAPQAGRFRVVQGLRTPRGYPGDATKAKEEWDAALVRSDGTHERVDIVLLAEVKSSPAAATPDFSRLHRGLQRLAHASAEAGYAFACAGGEVRVSGESLRRLQPHGRTLPWNVVYCCSAPAEAQPPALTAATKAVLLSEPACLEFAGRLAHGAAPDHALLAPVWDALTTAPRLRSALHQDETSRAVREAMLHPQDLVAAVAAQAAGQP